MKNKIIFFFLLHKLKIRMESLMYICIDRGKQSAIEPNHIMYLGCFFNSKYVEETSPYYLA